MPSERILLGPGPSMVPPEVTAALTEPMVGHMDPDLFPILDEPLRGEIWRIGLMGHSSQARWVLLLGALEAALAADGYRAPQGAAVAQAAAALAG